MNIRMNAIKENLEYQKILVNMLRQKGMLTEWSLSHAYEAIAELERINKGIIENYGSNFEL